QTDAGVIKLVDFGCARVWDNSELTTGSGAVIGTPAFMAPEMASGDSGRIDARTDLWAVGATLYQLLTGKTVHPARSPNEALVMAATRTASSLRSVAPGIAPELAAVIDRALSFAPSNRWPNARAMRAALAQAGPNTPLTETITGSGMVTVTIPEPL